MKLLLFLAVAVWRVQPLLVNVAPAMTLASAVVIGLSGVAVMAVGISVWIMSLVAQDGESHWMEGVLLLAVYVILGMAFYWLPA